MADYEGTKINDKVDGGVKVAGHEVFKEGVKAPTAAEAVQVDPALAYALAKEDAGTIGYQGGYHVKEGDVEAAAEAASIPSDLNEPC
ncbi:hypothetical protein OEZ86_005323 [Tetradesmus obliquus]|nr:hypothetical protein OEZ86_005323 [Tetradesmus obliquus]